MTGCGRCCNSSGATLEASVALQLRGVSLDVTDGFGHSAAAAGFQTVEALDPEIAGCGCAAGGAEPEPAGGGQSILFSIAAAAWAGHSMRCLDF